MLWILSTVAFVEIFAVANCQFLNCNWVNSRNCTTYEDFKECGSDGVTYANRCYFSKEHCRQPGTHLLHDGECLPADIPTTPSPFGGISGEEVILNFFCTSLSHKDCAADFQSEVCGTDNRTYSNFCEYDKARCTHRELHVKNFGPCTN